MSDFPFEFRHILTWWKSIPDAQETRKTLITRILEDENMIKIVESTYGSSGSNSAFYTRTIISSTIRRRSGPETDYIKEIKARTRCHHCNQLRHWKRVPSKLYKLNIRAIGNLTNSEATSEALKTKSLQIWKNRFCHLSIDDYVKTHCSHCDWTKSTIYSR